MGYNRGGNRRKARLKRQRREELRLAKAAGAAESAAKGKERARIAVKAAQPQP
jgi:hypothetical protein